MTSRGQAWASSGKNVIRLFGHHFAIAHIENHTIKRNENLTGFQKRDKGGLRIRNRTDFQR